MKYIFIIIWLIIRIPASVMVGMAFELLFYILTTIIFGIPFLWDFDKNRKLHWFWDSNGKEVHLTYIEAMEWNYNIGQTIMDILMGKPEKYFT